jgi:hypothetical protein
VQTLASGLARDLGNKNVVMPKIRSYGPGCVKLSLGPCETPVQIDIDGWRANPVRRLRE